MTDAAPAPMARALPDAAPVPTAPASAAVPGHGIGPRGGRQQDATVEADAEGTATYCSRNCDNRCSRSSGPKRYRVRCGGSSRHWRHCRAKSTMKLRSSAGVHRGERE